MVRSREGNVSHPAAAGVTELDKSEDQYETALIDLINQKRAGKPITPKERPRGEGDVKVNELLTSAARGRPDGGAAQERGRRRCGDPIWEEAGQKNEEGRARPEGNVDADRRDRG